MADEFSRNKTDLTDLINKRLEANPWNDDLPFGRQSGPAFNQKVKTVLDKFNSQEEFDNLNSVDKNLYTYALRLLPSAAGGAGRIKIRKHKPRKHKSSKHKPSKHKPRKHKSSKHKPRKHKSRKHKRKTRRR